MFDFAAEDLILIDALYQLVKVLNTPLSAFNGGLEPVCFRPLGYDVFLRHQV